MTEPSASVQCLCIQRSSHAISTFRTPKAHFSATSTNLPRRQVPCCHIMSCHVMSCHVTSCNDYEDTLARACAHIIHIRILVLYHMI